MLTAQVVRSSADRHVWKITDFTSSRTLLPIGPGLGAPQYYPPEIVLSERELPEYRSRSGSWSLGCIMYELTTGKRAFPDFSSLMNYHYSQNLSPRVSTD